MMVFYFVKNNNNNNNNNFDIFESLELDSLLYKSMALFCNQANNDLSNTKLFECLIIIHKWLFIKQHHVLDPNY